MSDLKPLSNSDHEKVENIARGALASSTTVKNASKYPKWLTYSLMGMVGIVVFCLIVFGSIRQFDVVLFDIWGDLGEGGAKGSQQVIMIFAHIAAFAFLPVSEIGTIIFIVVSIMDSGSHKILGKTFEDIPNPIYTLAGIITTFVGAMTNIVHAKPYLVQNAHILEHIFNWLLTISTPVILALIGGVVASFALDEIKQRGVYNEAYEQAHLHKDWLKYKARAIREVLYKSNDRGKYRAVRDNMTASEWNNAVMQELFVMQRFEQAIEKAQFELQETAKEQAVEIKKAARVEIRRTHPVNGIAENNNNELYTANCPDCGKMVGDSYKTQISATRALNGHKAGCKGKHEPVIS